jgi:hypothetical protein
MGSEPGDNGLALGLGPCGEGLRGFESHPPHQEQSNGNFSFLRNLVSSTLAHGDSAKVIRNYFPDLFLSGLDSGLVLRELGHYRLVQDSPICAYCRSDKREIVCS